LMEGSRSSYVAWSNGCCIFHPRQNCRNELHLFQVSHLILISEIILVFSQFAQILHPWPGGSQLGLIGLAQND
jgi:hypothetical protein